LCSAAIGPRGSHHCPDTRENRAISSASMVPADIGWRSMADPLLLAVFWTMPHRSVQGPAGAAAHRPDISRAKLDCTRAKPE
jgi:hypothetical protein